MARKYLDPVRMGTSRIVPETFMPGVQEKAPSRIDLRSMCASIRDQKDQDCTGFALSELMYFLRVENNLSPVLFSPAEIYYEERLKENDVSQDAGAWIPDGLWVLQNVGASPEGDDVYTGNYLHPPSPKAVLDAKDYRIKGWQEVSRFSPSNPETALSSVFTEFSHKNGLVAGIIVTPGIENASRGYCPMPSPLEEILGGHAIFLCGKIDDVSAPGGGWIIWQNSWSTSWGDRGFGYLPYAFLANPKMTMGIWKAWL